MSPTDAQLDEWEKLSDAAHHGPWIAGRTRDDRTRQVYCPSDGPLRVVVPIAETAGCEAAFIASAREAVPALIAALRASRSELERFRKGFEALNSDSGVPWEQELAYLLGEGPDPLPNPRAEAAEAECAKLQARVAELDRTVERGMGKYEWSGAVDARFAKLRAELAEARGIARWSHNSIKSDGEQPIGDVFSEAEDIARYEANEHEIESWEKP